MNITLHLTYRCNLNCDYCYVEKQLQPDMSFDTVREAVRFGKSHSASGMGITFFGGEPLLLEELMRKTMDWCSTQSESSPFSFNFKVITNGLLLEEEFLKYSQGRRMIFCLSHDGVSEAHDAHRKDHFGKGSFLLLEEKARMLLDYHPFATAIMVVNPDTAPHLFDSAAYLYGLGFRYLICSLNYGAAWKDGDFTVLEDQYGKLEQYYCDRTISGEKFYFSPFDMKINAYITGRNLGDESCSMGMKEVSIAPDGSIYPCVQFCGKPEYRIGDVQSGIDHAKRNRIIEGCRIVEPVCMKCGIRNRCGNYCACLNMQATGRLNGVSPVLCTHERIVTAIADRIAGRLYKKKSSAFIKKHYEGIDPLSSLIGKSLEKKE